MPADALDPASHAASHRGDLTSSGFETIDRDLAFLVECFGEVLEEIGEPELARHLQRVEHVPPGGAVETAPPVDQNQREAVPERLAQVDSIWFQLLNLVEENVAQQTRRLRESIDGPAAEPGLWGRVFADLAAQKLDERKIADALPHVRVEPVLTAHPTESKRATVIEQHRAIYRLLGRLGDATRTKADQAADRDEIKAALERLWRTGEILLRKPDISAERAMLVFYLREVFPEALAGLDRRLRDAWEAAGFDPGSVRLPENLPQLKFGFWVGGDRDGHPGVTHAVTRETLGELRRGAITVHRRGLQRLAERLSLSIHGQKPGDELLARLSQLSALHPQAARLNRRRNPEEPWRQMAFLMAAHLPIEPLVEGGLDDDVRTDDPSRIDPSLRRMLFDVEPDESGARYATPEQLLDDLQLLRRSLVEVGARRLAETDVDPIIRTLRTFGFHLAALDIRQNSRFHDVAMSQLLAAANVEDADSWGAWSEERRLELLNRELTSPRPFARYGRNIGPECDELLATYRVVAEHIDLHGRDGIGALIISQTARVSDLLTVYILAREAGLARYHVAVGGKSGSLVCPLPVVPLFETIDDLDAAPRIMREFLAHPVTRRSLASRPGRPPSLLVTRGQTLPVQQVMVGYSDSNKDSGILAAQWALNRCQIELTKVADEQQVRMRFFHGRGGTISRGAGPTHRFLEALPARSLGGDVRLTEQGETVAQKYANAVTSTYNLELLLAGVTGVTLENRANPPAAHALEPVAQRLAVSSRKAYSQLLEMPGFIEFFSQATPIDVLEQSNIGSRPARRTGRRTLADLRAIPWVFSWNQSRFYLPGWFGIGTALEELAQQEPEQFDQLADSIHTWRFMRYVLTNVETNLASADASLMRRYADLLDDPALRDSVLGVILQEFDRTERMITRIFGGGSFEERRPRMVKTLRLRDARLRVLHGQQIALLRRYRGLRNTDPDAAEALLPQLLLNVNAIASGLRTTG